MNPRLLKLPWQPCIVLPYHCTVFDDASVGWVDWFASMGKPLAIGLVLLGIFMAVFGYFAVRGAWRLYVVRQWRRRAHERQSPRP